MKAIKIRTCISRVECVYFFELKYHFSQSIFIEFRCSKQFFFHLKFYECIRRTQKCPSYLKMCASANAVMVWKSGNLWVWSRCCWEELTFPGWIKVGNLLCVCNLDIMCTCFCVCTLLLMCVIYEACEQSVCATSQTARGVSTNERSVCKRPHSWPLLCSLLPWSTFISSALLTTIEKVTRTAGSRTAVGVRRRMDKGLLL